MLEKRFYTVEIIISLDILGVHLLNFYRFFHYLIFTDHLIIIVLNHVIYIDLCIEMLEKRFYKSKTIFCYIFGCAPAQLLPFFALSHIS